MQKRVPDERIAKLSYAKFEEEFGFKPGDKIEQNWFALKKRPLDPRMRKALEAMEARKAAPPLPPLEIPK